ncbi:MAG: hypothetical protein ACRDFT_08270 [bacterium]
MRQGRHVLLVAVLALALVVGLPVLAGAQNIDQRLARIKAGLEREGLRVLEVRYLPADRSGPAYWFGVTAAAYSQPNWPDVAKQALVSWLVMNETTAPDPPQTMLMSAQVWTKYMIQIGQQNTLVSEFSRALKAARNDAEKNAAVNKVLARFLVRIFDLERNQFVDAKDFVNKNFID